MKKTPITLNDQQLEHLPAGNYWFGDLCYVFPDKEWGDFCEVLFGAEDDNRKKLYVFNYDGIPFFFGYTAYGDGGYPLSVNGDRVASLGVDAGCISIVPRQLIDKWETHKDAARLGHFLDIPELEITYIKGDFHLTSSTFGRVTVITNWDDAEDDYEYDEDDCDEDEDEE